MLSVRIKYLSAADAHLFLNTAWGDMISERRVREIYQEFREGTRTQALSGKPIQVEKVMTD